MKKFMGAMALAAVAWANPAVGGVLADSYEEYSGVQGQDGWEYGFYDGDVEEPYTPADFEHFPEFGTVESLWYIILGEDAYWTIMRQVGGHPNGTTTSENRLEVEHHAVRRWVSDHDGAVRVTGELLDANSNYGNGVIGRIFLDDTEIWSADIANGEGVKYNFVALVDEGTTIDFVIDPKDDNDWADSSLFFSTVWSSDAGDMNCDGDVTVYDITPFIYAVTRPDRWSSRYPDCDMMRGDVTGDGRVDVADVRRFVRLLAAVGEYEIPRIGGRYLDLDGDVDVRLD